MTLITFKRARKKNDWLQNNVTSIVMPATHFVQQNLSCKISSLTHRVHLSYLTSKICMYVNSYFVEDRHSLILHNQNLQAKTAAGKLSARSSITTALD